MSKRYLILHLNSNGDLLYATAIAKQIKEIDDPTCYITWAVAAPFKNVLLNNPHIDVIWEIPAQNYSDIKNRVFRQVQKEVEQRAAEGEWDEIICPQLMYENMWRYDGTIRRAVLKAYPKKIADVTPVLRLTQGEVHKVRQFATENHLSNYKNVILFECSPLSGQSSVTPAFAKAVAESILKTIPDTAFILSSNRKIESHLSNIMDGSIISFRENAELTKYCTHFIGCSSGITWISLSDTAKKLTMLQLSSTGINPVGRDFKREGLDASQLIEMYHFTERKVVDCVQLMLENQFLIAKEKYHQSVPPSREFTEGIFLYLLNHGYFIKAFLFMLRNLIAQSFHYSLLYLFFTLPFRLPFIISKKKN